MRSLLTPAFFLPFLIVASAQAADWNGRWGIRGPHGSCSQNADDDGEVLEFSGKEVVGFEWNAEIKRVSKTGGVYAFDLFTPESEMNGPAEKSKWLIVVAKDGKTMMISTKGGKDWEVYDRCK